ncbi:MAG: hypothetical protein EBV06_04560 [Planctomycetia bacterium]|nr:hypothetical protein [Planctomycetia bacterium]
MRLALALLVLVPVVVAQPKKGDDAPKVLMALPFGIPAGRTTRVELRGLRLDNVRDAKTAAGPLKLLNKGKVTVPNQQDASKVGDSRLQLDVTAPTTGDAIDVTLTTADGRTTMHRLGIDPTALIAEKEPNDSFRQAQEVQPGQTIAGAIERAQDVDVYRMEVKAGQTIRVEVRAARWGGALDAFLSVYDAAGQLIDSCDDIKGSTDAAIDFRASRDGVYYFVVSDANDQGGVTHAYRLHVERLASK